MANIPSRLCKSCGQIFFKPISCSARSWDEDYKSCSRSCSQKGKIAWNKGIKGVQVAWNKGLPFSKGIRKKMSLAKLGKPWTADMRKNILPSLPKGESHHNWKGDAVGYMALHAWVKRELGKAHNCRHCGLKEKPKLTARGKPMKSTKNYFEWSNISGTYKRDIADWQMLCVRCHSKFDKLIS